jgi:hypothetical protein
VARARSRFDLTDAPRTRSPPSKSATCVSISQLSSQTNLNWQWHWLS